AAVLVVLLALAGLTASTLLIAEQRDVAERQRQQAELQRAQARRAVDDMYTQVAEKWLADQPQLEKLQREFLEKAATFYEEFAKEQATNPDVRRETAKAIHRLGAIRQKLGE